MLALPYYKEEWFDIPKFDGLYQCSSFLNVRSLTRKTKGGRHQEQSGKTVQGRIMKPYLYPNGYYGFEFYKDGKVVHKLLHRIIAEVFIPNPDNLPEVDHINRITTDNRIENLRWSNRKTQNNNRDLTNMINKYSTPIEQMDLDGNIVATYKSMAEAKHYGYSPSQICCCCKGKINAYKGYIWRYATENPLQ